MLAKLLPESSFSAVLDAHLRVNCANCNKLSQNIIFFVKQRHKFAIIVLDRQFQQTPFAFVLTSL